MDPWGFLRVLAGAWGKGGGGTSCARSGNRPATRSWAFSGAGETAVDDWPVVRGCACGKGAGAGVDGASSSWP